MVRNEQLHFIKAPTEYPIPGETLKKQTSEFDPSQAAPSGGLVTKTVCLSLDPYMRGRMRDGGKSYVPAFEKNQPIQNFGISKVLKSDAEGIKEGDHVYTGQTPFAEYNVFDAEAVKGIKVIENKENLPWTSWVGAAGMPGMTSWWGLEKIGQPKKGETIFVSGASGGVGQMVISLAKVKGLKVIASAGSDEKVEFLKSLGADVAFNYKTQKTQEILEQNPFDIYWDNVGGETLEAVFATINPRGRIIECGQASQYNTTKPYGIPNTFYTIAKSLKIQGFIILTEDTTGFYDEVPRLVSEMKIPEPKEHHIRGLDNGEAMVALLKGDSFGKPVIVFDE